jgi:hypothetical protein
MPTVDITRVPDHNESDIKCDFYLNWCLWAKNLPANDEGRTRWLKNGVFPDCANCYSKCKANANNWPMTDCPMGGEHGPRWPNPNDNWQPVWPD